MAANSHPYFKLIGKQVSIAYIKDRKIKHKRGKLTKIEWGYLYVASSGGYYRIKRKDVLSIRAFHSTYRFLFV